jgi:hypothetical protein
MQEPENHVLLANRSACHAALAADAWKPQEKVAQWYRALADATACTELPAGREWAKGHLRKATAEFNLVAAVKKWEVRKAEDAKWDVGKKQRGSAAKVCVCVCVCVCVRVCVCVCVCVCV